jgi:hypothetical protein
MTYPSSGNGGSGVGTSGVSVGDIVGVKPGILVGVILPACFPQATRRTRRTIQKYRCEVGFEFKVVFLTNLL